jgi:hypothetical protein
LDFLTGKLDQKADRHEVEALQQQLAHESERIDEINVHIQHQKASAVESTAWKTWAIPAIATLFLVAVTVLQILRG